MSDEGMSVGTAYAFDILSTWNAIKKLSDENCAYYLQGRIDSRKYSEYISLMRGLWLELCPMVQKRSEFGDLPEKFAGYEKDFIQPAKLYLSPERSMKLQLLLREALHKLRITKFDEVAR